MTRAAVLHHHADDLPQRRDLFLAPYTPLVRSNPDHGEPFTRLGNRSRPELLGTEGHPPGEGRRRAEGQPRAREESQLDRIPTSGGPAASIVHLGSRLFPQSFILVRHLIM